MTRTMTGLALATALMMAATTHAAEVKVGADVGSAYVFRGVTLNDGFVVQPRLEVTGLPDLTFGMWANFDLDDFDGTLAENQLSEIDLYGAIVLPVEEFDMSLGYTEYAYPSSVAEANREVWAVAVLELELSPTFTVYYGLDGAIEKSFYGEFELTHKLDMAQGMGAELKARVAYTYPDEGEEGFSHYEVSLGITEGTFSASITYVGQIDDEILPDGPYDVDVYGSIGLSHSF